MDIEVKKAKKTLQLSPEKMIYAAAGFSEKKITDRISM
jgi:hypothetical protein